MRERKNEDDYNKTHHVYDDPLKLVQEIQREKGLGRQDSKKALNIETKRQKEIKKNGEKTPDKLKGPKTKPKTKKAKHRYAVTSSSATNEPSTNIKFEPSTSKETSSNNLPQLPTSGGYVNNGFKQENDLTVSKDPASKSSLSHHLDVSRCNLKEDATVVEASSRRELDTSAATTKSSTYSQQTTSEQAKRLDQIPVLTNSSAILGQTSDTEKRLTNLDGLSATQSEETAADTAANSDLTIVLPPLEQTSNDNTTYPVLLTIHSEPSTSDIQTATTSSSANQLQPSTSKNIKESPYAELPPRKEPSNYNESGHNLETVTPPEPPPPRPLNARRISGLILEDKPVKSEASGEVELGLGNPVVSSNSINSSNSKTLDDFFRRGRRRRMFLLLITLFLFFLLVGVAGVVIYLVSLPDGEEAVETSNQVPGENNA